MVGPNELLRQSGDQAIALVFGSEGFGVSEQASALADQAMLIPMAGMVQSLNLSVSVAIAVHACRAEAMAQDAPGDLSDDEQIALYDRWVARGRRPGIQDERPSSGSGSDKASSSNDEDDIETFTS